MSYWAAAQLQPQRDALAIHFLRQNFEVYAPRLRERRRANGRAIVRTPLLFVSYAFVWIELQWHRARWSPGVVRLVMNGAGPAVVPDDVIAEIQARETGGLIELPRFRPGDQVRVTRGAFQGRLALYDGQPGPERVAVLLQLLGAERRLELAADAVEAAP